MNLDFANQVMDSLLECYDPKEIGILISLLSHKYIKMCNISKEQFITSLSNSIDKLEKD